MIEERGFSAEAASVPAARRFVLERLAMVPRPTADAIGVMVSELVTNAVRHARTDFRVRMDLDEGVVRVEVTDEGPGVPEVQHLPPPSTFHGRGLFLVRSLADDWGISWQDDGRSKGVWFRLCYPRNG
jgi:anti-sigma regulatory factor (Ser/Thr protein kinase)